MPYILYFNCIEETLYYEGQPLILIALYLHPKPQLCVNVVVCVCKNVCVINGKVMELGIR